MDRVHGSRTWLAHVWESGDQKRLSGPVGDSDGFVGFEPADVAQDGECLAAGDKAEGAFEAP